MNFLKKNKPYLWFTILGSFLILSNSCQEKKDPTFEDFFYPFNDWEEGMVYEYRPVSNDTLPAEYWYFRKLAQDSSIYFTGQYFDHTFTPRQIFNGTIESNGLIFRDYFLYEYDSLGNAISNPAEIIASNSFPFGKLDSTSVFLHQLKWQNPTEEYPDAYVEVIRKRQMTGKGNYNYKNKKYDCVEFLINEKVSDFNDGHLEPEYKTFELYGKNLGMIYYRKEINENFVLEYELRDTFSMKRFEEKFSKYISE